MTSLLPVAANVFSVIGLIDIILRTAKETSSFLIQNKNAPQEFDQLREEIDESVLLIEDARRYCFELQQYSARLGPSLSSVPKALTSSMNYFISALDSFDRSLRPLVVWARKHAQLGETRSSFQFVLAKEQVISSLRRTEAAKLNLVAALILMGKRHDAFRHEILNSNLETSFRNLNSKADVQSILFERNIEKVRCDVAGVSSSIKLSALQLQQQSKHHHTLTQSCIRASTKQAAKQILQASDQLIKHHTNAMASFSSRLDSLFRQLGSTQIETKPMVGPIEYNGPDLRLSISTIMNLKGELRDAIMKIQQQYHGDANLMRRLYHLEDDFIFLSNSAMEEAVRLSYSSTSTSVNERFCPRRLKESSKSNADHNKTKEDVIHFDQPCSRSLKALRDEARKENDKTYTQQFNCQGRAGKLLIIAVVPRPSSRTKSEPNAAAKMRMLFRPSDDIKSMYLDIYFTRLRRCREQVQLCVQLNAFALVPLEDKSRYFDLMRFGSLQAIDGAIRNGEISPYGMDEHGRNLCFIWASWFGRDDIFQYLQDQGVGLDNFKCDYGALLALRYHVCEGEADAKVEDGMFQVLRRLLKSGVSNELLETFPASSWYRPPVPRENQQSGWKRWVRVWREESHHEFKREWEGQSPLLDWLTKTGRPALEACRLLLQNGADINAQDHHGNNAIQYAMRSSSNEEQRDILVEKLCMLVENGANVNHLNHAGISPADYTDGLKCADEWNQALRICGHNHIEVYDTNVSRKAIFQALRCKLQTQDPIDFSNEDWADEASDSLDREDRGSSYQEDLFYTSDDEMSDHCFSDDDQTSEVSTEPRSVERSMSLLRIPEFHRLKTDIEEHDLSDLSDGGAVI